MPADLESISDQLQATRTDVLGKLVEVRGDVLDKLRADKLLGLLLPIVLSATLAGIGYLVKLDIEETVKATEQRLSTRLAFTESSTSGSSPSTRTSTSVARRSSGRSASTRPAATRRP